MARACLSCWESPCVCTKILHDSVHKPTHYNKNGIECIEAIEASMTQSQFQGYLKGNIIKYLWRYEYKNKQEDLDKALWYMTKLNGNYKKTYVRETQSSKEQQG